MPQPSPDELEVSFQRLLAAHPLPPSPSTHSGETIYDVLKTLPEASAYHRLLERHPRLVALLADVSDGEVTLFLPVNAAWEGAAAAAAAAAAGLSGMDADAEEALLGMHISPHFLAPAYLRSMTNVPTIHAPAATNGPQVFSLRLGEDGWTVSGPGGGGRFLPGPSGIRARNGLVYRIDRVITPPAPLLQALRLRGTTYSTLLRAVQVAGFDAEALGARRPGGTLFAPSDRAFAALGPEAVRFLTETAEGSRYLRALLRVHFCPARTHYTNLVWPQNDSGGERRTSADEDRVYKGSMRRELPSALGAGGRTVSLEVSVTRYMCLITVAVNGTPVVEQDIGGEDGVAQGIDEVLLPGGVVVAGKESEDVISRIKSALQPYV